MKYQSKSSVAYLFRNFWQLAFVALPTAVLMAFFLNGCAEVDFIHALIHGELNNENINQWLVAGLTVVRYLPAWWQALLTVVVLAFGASMLTRKVARHMRVGIMNTFPLRSTLRLFPKMLAFVACFLALLEVGNLLAVGITYLLRSVNNAVLLAIVALVLSCLFRAIVAFLFGLLLLTVPMSLSENYRINVALSYSVRSMSKRKGMLAMFAVSFPVAKIVVTLINHLLAHNWMQIVLYGVVYFFVIMLIPVLAYKLYYDDLGCERKDVGQIMF